MMRDQVRAGVTLVDISPELGVELGGYPYFERANSGCHDPLIAAALYLEEGAVRSLVIATDLFWITRGQADDIRRAVEETTGVPASAVFITCSHTHSAPWMSVVFEASDDQPDFATRIDDDYIAFVRRQCAEAARRAMENLFEASVEFGLSRCGVEDGIGGNRRAPAGGLVDDELPAIVVKDASGRIRAVWTKYSLHPTILHGENIEVSADFPGALRRHFATSFPEAVLLYSMGTAGDQSPRYFAVSKDFSEVDRFGKALSARLCDAVRGSVPLGEGCLSLGWRTVGLAPREYRALDLIDAELSQLRDRENALKERGAPYLDLQNANLSVLGKECELNNARRGSRYSTRRFEACSPFEVTCLTLDRRTAFVFMPGELFCAFGAAIKAASPFVETFIVSLSNGDLPGYCVTPAAREEGGYEPGNSLLEVTSGARLVASALEILSDLYEEEGVDNGVQ